MDKKFTRETKLADKREDWLYRLSYMDMHDGRHSLLPLSLVCHRWNKLANGMLYEEIQVGDGNIRPFTNLICGNRPNEEVRKKEYVD